MTLYALTLVQATANLRIDLNDPAGASQRWADTDLQRALDRANERLSSVEPDLETIQLATVANQALYPKPAGALWIDRLEYPSGQWPASYPAFTDDRSATLMAPNTAPVATQVVDAASALTAGTRQWATTYSNPLGGETLRSPSTTQTIVTTPRGIQLALATPPPDTLYINVYRTIAGGGTFLYNTSLSVLPSQSSYTYLDELADGALGPAAPVANTTGGIDCFRLQLPPDQIPPDATGVITVRYALKHELDAGGTTIPERHWDALYDGAKVAAIDIYLSNISDNFVYADGQLRDRVDDTKSVDAWRAFRDLLEMRFTTRLKQIRDEQIQSSRFTPAWGDVPLRWERT